MGWERGGSAGPGAVKEGVRGVPRSKSTGARADERGRKRKGAGTQGTRGDQGVSWRVKGS